ncbi:MAG TPA: hypothetical protein VGB37_08455 [Candidatus Lokiarchaeia archaeon]
MRLIIKNKAEEDNDHEEEDYDEAKDNNLNEIKDLEETFYESENWESNYNIYESTDKYENRNYFQKSYKPSN